MQITRHWGTVLADPAHVVLQEDLAALDEDGDVVFL